MDTPHSKQNPTSYVLGFAFNSFDDVCLITKRKPAWQAGFQNGVGGKIEPGETELQAMCREFREETGVDVSFDRWIKTFVMRFQNGAVVHVFTVLLSYGERPTTMETEVVTMNSIYDCWFRSNRLIPNLAWLIPLCLHELRSQPHERMIVNDQPTAT